MNTSAQPGKNALPLYVYTTHRTTDRHRTDVAPILKLWLIGCQNSTALNSLHCSIRSKVLVNFADVCGFKTSRAPRKITCSSTSTVFTIQTSYIQSVPQNLRVHTFFGSPVFCTAVLGYRIRPPGDNSIRIGRMDSFRQKSNSTGTLPGTFSQQTLLELLAV